MHVAQLEQKNVSTLTRENIPGSPSAFSFGSKVTRRKFVRGEGEPGDEATIRGAWTFPRPQAMQSTYVCLFTLDGQASSACGIA